MSRTMTKFFQLPFLLTICAALLCSCSHESDEDDGGDGGETPTVININPASVELNANESITIVFNASGGSGNYSWSISDSGLGSIDGNGSTAVYTSQMASGVNVVMVTDDASGSGATTITQD